MGEPVWSLERGGIYCLSLTGRGGKVERRENRPCPPCKRKGPLQERDFFAKKRGEGGGILFVSGGGKEKGNGKDNAPPTSFLTGGKKAFLSVPVRAQPFHQGKDSGEGSRRTPHCKRPPACRLAGGCKEIGRHYISFPRCREKKEKGLITRRGRKPLGRKSPASCKKKDHERKKGIPRTPPSEVLPHEEERPFWETRGWSYQGEGGGITTYSYRSRISL